MVVQVTQPLKGSLGTALWLPDEFFNLTLLLLTLTKSTRL